MKNLMKATAVLITGAMMTSLTLSAEAVIPVEDQLTNPYISETEPKVPDEFEQIEDYGMLSDSVESEIYTAYWLNEKHESFLILYNYGQCYTEMQLYADSADCDWESIYEKYRDELDFDTEYIGNGLVLYDTMDEEGNPFGSYGDFEDRSVFAHKKELLQQMYAEMYEAGLHMDVEYRDYYAKAAGVFTNASSVSIYDAEIDAAMLQEELAEINENLEVCPTSDEWHGAYYVVENVNGTMDEALKVAEVIKTYYPESDLGVPYSRNDIFTYAGTVAIDLLEGLPASNQPNAGDVNQDGKISVLDAIFLSKAAVQAVRLNETQTTAGDFNGDGVVNTEDVTLLLMYLVDKIDTLPVAAV